MVEAPNLYTITVISSTLTSVPLTALITQASTITVTLSTAGEGSLSLLRKRINEKFARSDMLIFFFL